MRRLPFASLREAPRPHAGACLVRIHVRLDGQEQEHGSQRGVDTQARVQCAAPTAPARTLRSHC